MRVHLGSQVRPVHQPQVPQRQVHHPQALAVKGCLHPVDRGTRGVTHGRGNRTGAVGVAAGAPQVFYSKGAGGDRAGPELLAPVAGQAGVADLGESVLAVGAVQWVRVEDAGLYEDIAGPAAARVPGAAGLEHHPGRRRGVGTLVAADRGWANVRIDPTETAGHLVGDIVEAQARVLRQGPVAAGPRPRADRLCVAVGGRRPRSRRLPGRRSAEDQGEVLPSEQGGGRDDRPCGPGQVDRLRVQRPEGVAADEHIVHFGAGEGRDGQCSAPHGRAPHDQGVADLHGAGPVGAGQVARLGPGGAGAQVPDRYVSLAGAGCG